jgi:hypothetical protein
LKRFVTAAPIVAAAVAAEIAFPGNPIYHTGWYNVALAALAIVVIVTGRTAYAKASKLRARLAILAVLIGATASGVAGLANGLFAPDNREIVGAPGQTVRVEALGALSFPLAGERPGSAPMVTLERPFHAPLQIGDRPRNAGSFILRAQPRDVVYVEARDLHGNRLTVTQPNGTVFLSPVLLMQQHQNIAGMELPFDSFNVPAARRVVKAILFAPAQAAVVLHGTGAPGETAVLFAVDDENDRPLPQGIALSAGGRAVRIDGLRLKAAVAAYPQIEVLSAPNVAAVAIGTLLTLGGLIALGA